jgi:hypothetical protein
MFDRGFCAENSASQRSRFVINYVSSMNRIALREAVPL